MDDTKYIEMFVSALASNVLIALGSGGIDALAGCGKSRIRSGFPSESWVQDRVDGAEWAVGRFSKVLGVGFNGIAHQPPVTSCGCRQQVAHPDQVVGGQCKAKHPADPRRSAMARLAQPGDRFEPAEDLLDAFTLLLTYQIAGMTSSPLINDSSGFASNVRGDLMVAQLRNKFLAVVALVRAQRDAMPAWDRFHHRHGRLWFRAAGGLGHAAVDREAVAVLHQHVAGVAEL